MEALSSVPARWLALAGLAAALLIVPTASARSAASIKGVGAGKLIGGVAEFELSAHVEDDPTTPENGFGQAKVEFLDFFGTLISHTIDVRCVNPAIIGDRPSARITGVITRSSVPGAVGQAAGVQVSDGGEPSGAPVDSFEFSTTLSPAETTCLIRPPADLPPNVEQGNIVVKL